MRIVMPERVVALMMVLVSMCVMSYLAKEYYGHLELVKASVEKLNDKYNEPTKRNR